MPKASPSLFLQRNYSAHVLLHGIIFIILELLIITQFSQLFKNTINKAKISPITWLWTVRSQPTNCLFRVNWYRFYVPNCEALKVGEEYEVISSLVESTDTLFFKQISLKIQGNPTHQVRQSSVNTWFGIFYRLRDVWRSKLFSLLEEHLQPDTAVLAIGLLFGDDSGFSQDTRNNLTTTGLQHLTAASGYNISLVAGAVLPLINSIWKRKSKEWLLLICIWSFVFFAQAGASLLRAGMAATFTSFTRVLQRSSQAWWSTYSAILIVTFMSPYLWWDISFQLSVAATTGILLFTQRFPDRSRAERWMGFYDPDKRSKSNSFFQATREYLRENILISLAALSLVLPLLLHYFNSFSVLSIVSSVLVVWLIPWATIAAVGSILLSTTLPAYSLVWRAVEQIVTLPLEGMLKIISLLSQLGGHLVWSTTWATATVWTWWGCMLFFYFWKSQKKAPIPPWK